MLINAHTGSHDKHVIPPTLPLQTVAVVPFIHRRRVKYSAALICVCVGHMAPSLPLQQALIEREGRVEGFTVNNEGK